MDKLTVTRDIVEAAARALGNSGVIPGKTWDDLQPSFQFLLAQRAKHMLDAAAPLIEASVLERTARGLSLRADNLSNEQWAGAFRYLAEEFRAHGATLRAQP